MEESKYTTTIGLEVHAELNTLTKMFCDSKNDPEEKRPNVNICPVCMAEPGTLPVINRAAVKHVLRVGLAFGAELADFTEFDRKNYFYPDIPKGYQISQFAYPLVSGGVLNGIDITRVHLEEDTARSQHVDDEHSLVDYNRAGLPLMELVTEPVIHTAKDAGAFARELQLLLRTLGASDANMEKGQMRVEANISVSKTETFGTKVEIKNLNSFKVVEKAIEYEVKRQIAELEKGGEIVQETRGWNENKQSTFSQRKKENSDEYRYFPDPDLPKLKIGEIPELASDLLKKTLPELPWDKRVRYEESYGIKAEDIEIYVRDTIFGDFFEGVAQELSDKKQMQIASNYITSDIMGALGSDGAYEHPQWLVEAASIQRFAALIQMLSDNKLSSRAAKDILMDVVQEGKDPEALAQEKGLMQESGEDALIPMVESIIKEHSSVADEYRSGKDSALQFFVGQGMKASRGSANPQVLRTLLEKMLKAD